LPSDHPLLFHALYAKREKVDETKALRFSWYSTLLSRILNNRIKVVLLAAVFIGITVLILPYVGSEYIPQSGTNEFSLDIKLKEGTQLERTEGLVKNLESMVNEVLGDRADIVYSQVGPSESSISEKAVFQNENTATVKVRLKPSALGESEAIINEIGDVTRTLPDAEVTILRNESALESTLGTDESPLVVEVTGRDIGVLDTLTREIKQHISGMPAVLISDQHQEGAPEMDGSLTDICIDV
jgi:HAE1 family hydrophobic/amphiphilic exporter-1